MVSSAVCVIGSEVGFHAPNREGDPASFGELGRIAEQIQKRLADFYKVSSDLTAIGSDINFELIEVPFDQRLNGCGHLADETVDINFLHEEGHFTRFDFGKVENIVDEREQMSSCAANLVQVRRKLFDIQVLRFIDEHLAIA